MASIWELLGMKMAQPVASARITRTPIFEASMPNGVAANYNAGRIEISPEQLQHAAPWIIPHEEAHAIFDRAQLQNLGHKLASHVSETARNFVLGSKVYQGAPDYGEPAQIANEGLGHSIGDSDETPYINYVGSQIKDPKLAAALKRLHTNAIAGRKSWEKIQ